MVDQFNLDGDEDFVLGRILFSEDNLAVGLRRGLAVSLKELGSSTYVSSKRRKMTALIVDIEAKV